MTFANELTLQNYTVFSTTGIPNYHLWGKVEVKRLVTWPEASGENSNGQVNPWICMWIIAQILLKAGLIFPSQC